MGRPCGMLFLHQKKTASNNSYFSDCYSKMEMWCLTQLSLKKEITNIILH